MLCDVANAPDGIENAKLLYNLSGGEALSGTYEDVLNRYNNLLQGPAGKLPEMATIQQQIENQKYDQAKAGMDAIDRWLAKRQQVDSAKGQATAVRVAEAVSQATKDIMSVVKPGSQTPTPPTPQHGGGTPWYESPWVLVGGAVLALGAVVLVAKRKK